MPAGTVKILSGYLTARQVAQMFGVAEITIRYWELERALPRIEIPGDGKPAVRYDKAAVLKWAAEHGRRAKKLIRVVQ